MPEYRRHFNPGGTFFFTVVTYHRYPFFNSGPARTLLGEAFRSAQERYPFTLNAICLLPDHLHCIWTLPDNENDNSIRWRTIKSYFTQRYKGGFHANTEISASRKLRRESGIWQRRFWEHIIFDDLDYERHINYIHYNPVKHGLVEDVESWQWSSFHRYVKLGWYPSGSKIKEDEIPSEFE